jgi:hypothetical protein
MSDFLQTLTEKFTLDPPVVPCELHETSQVQHATLAGIVLVGFHVLPAAELSIRQQQARVVTIDLQLHHQQQQEDVKGRLLTSRPFVAGVRPPSDVILKQHAKT